MMSICGCCGRWRGVKSTRIRGQAFDVVINGAAREARPVLSGFGGGI